jgi:hypothetical protein
MAQTLATRAYQALNRVCVEPEQTIPSVTQHVWEGAEPRLRAVIERLRQRANPPIRGAGEGQTLPQSMGVLASGKAAPVPERVGSPVLPILNKSLSSLSRVRKRRVSNRNLRAFMPERFQETLS